VILLARHGETDDNRPPIRIQGSTDTPLNDTGRAQARALTDELAGEGAAALYTSHLSRARETAEIVGARLGLEAVVDERFAEGHRGEWEGLLWDEVAADDPAGYAAWRAAGPDFRFPGGESLGEHSARVLAALEDVRTRGPLPAVVVCHGGSIRVALCDREGLGLEEFHRFSVPNVGIVRL
jgi:broad specificity phosphatase PhoE